MTAALLSFESVGKRYPGGMYGLAEVSFSIAAGEMAFVTGHSGAGKSTLLRLIHMSARPSSGRVLFDGCDLAPLRGSEVARHRRRLGVVFQDHRLLTDRSVFDNVALPLLIAGLRRTEIAPRVREVLQPLGLAERAGDFPIMLSTGEQQRVGIARALVSQPALLIADEPTGNLDPQLAEEVMTLFSTLPSKGTAVLVASHDLHLVRKMRRRVLVLDHGALIDDIRIDDIRTDDIRVDEARVEQSLVESSSVEGGAE